MLAHLALAALLAAPAAASPIDSALETRQAASTPQYYIIPNLVCTQTPPANFRVKFFMGPDKAGPPPNGQTLFITNSPRFTWDLWYLPADGKGQIKTTVRNVTKCIDAGSNPANGVQLKIWDCYDVPQQQWQFHDDKIQLVGTNLCFDVRDGNLLGDLQTWQCYDDNPNQEFHTQVFTL